MPYGSVGGMERLALYLYEFYKKQGYNVKAVKIIKLDTDIISFGEDEYGLSSVDFYQLSAPKRFYFYLKIPFLVRKIVKQNKIDYSISFGDMANVFSSLTFTNEFKIASIHALKSVEFVNKTFFNRLFKLSFRTTYYFIDKVICISDAIKKDLIEKCKFKFKEKLKVIYNPHDIAKMVALSLINLESKEELEIFKKDVVLFLGRLSIQKSPWHLVKSFSLALKQNPNTNLVFIGDGDVEVENHLIKLIKHLKINNNVFFLGRKSNPYPYIKKAKIIALSSYYEGTPNVIVEAIAIETPVVTSNCTDGISELMSLEKCIKKTNYIETETGLITPNFFKGYLDIPVDFDFIEEEYDFATALDKILNDESYKAALMLNKTKLLAKFDLAIVAKKYLD